MALITDTGKENRMVVYCDGNYVGYIDVDYEKLKPDIRSDLKKTEDRLKKDADPFLLSHDRHVHIHMFEFDSKVQEFAVWCGPITEKPPKNWWKSLGDDSPITI